MTVPTFMFLSKRLHNDFAQLHPSIVRKAEENKSVSDENLKRQRRHNLVNNSHGCHFGSLSH